MSTIMQYPAVSPVSDRTHRSEAYDLGDVTLKSDSTNIDEMVYPYSSEYDRSHHPFLSSPKAFYEPQERGMGIASGVPKTGMYAQDGIWDDEDTVSESTTLRPASGSTVGTSKNRRSSRPTPTLSASGSIKSRGRSGTISNGTPVQVEMKEDKGGMFHWNRKSNPSTPVMDGVETMPASAPAGPINPRHSLRKEKSKSRLRGKGRRGELSLASSNADESFEAPPPLPPTPASFITSSSPALSNASFLSPRTVPSRIPDQENVPPRSHKSSWKRGMEKIFKSKSSIALREAFNMTDPNRPPAVPLRPDGLPKATDHPLGPAFTSSTPPMPSTKDEVWGLYGPTFSPPTTATSSTFGFNQPLLPPDPFASNLDLTSNPSSPASPPRPSLARNSSSIRDIKNFLSPKSHQLTKAKSLASIRDSISDPVPQDQVPELPRVPKRVKSAMGLNRKHSMEVIKEDAPLVRPQIRRLPTESPPLVAPHPPFFSTPVSADPSGGTPAPMTPPPTVPLPAPPVSSPMTAPGSVKRSASGAVLLPRSRSTSMSLKAPPTSSSFFDLYEQLGIWPTTSDKSICKDSQPNSEQDLTNPKAVEDSKEIAEAPGEIITVSASPSAAFSIGSWEAAISAFPLVDDVIPRTIPEAGETTLDYGQPVVSDDMDFDGCDNLLTTSPPELTDTESVSGNVMQRATSCSTGHDQRGANSTQTTAAPVRASTATFGGGISMSRGHSAQSGGTGGSGNSSHVPSRDERQPPHARVGRKGKQKGSASDGEEDDVPLSKLHPQAAELQRENTKRKSHRSERVKSQGRNPGAGSGWNGEGGVPSELLAQKLEALLLRVEEKKYPWQIAAVASSSRQNTLQIPTKPQSTESVPRERSRTEPIGGTQFVPAVKDRPLPTTQDHLAPPSDEFKPASAAPNPAMSVKTSPALSSSSEAVPVLTRAHSSGTSASHTRAITQPIRRTGTRVPAIIGHVGGPRTMLEVFPETTARDVLHSAQQRGQLTRPEAGMDWVVVELFGEVGCQRHVREYETLQSVIQGWDLDSGKNSLLLCQSNRAATTWARSVPSTAPFVGSYVQYETKKGKWSKKYLETRGGQLFMAKNEKNKEEIQINTLFHDIYSMPRPKGAPKPFVFMMKRNEPASKFTNPQEYIFTFSVDEQIGWKIFAAIYDAKSVAMSQAMPHLLSGVAGASVPMPRRRTETEGSAPLIDLVKDRKEEHPAFTGKGLLKI